MVNWQRIEIRYETQNVPPPFSFEIKALLAKNATLDVEFQLKYTDRDDLEEDEILDEGFSGDDDIEWKGSLPGVWINSLNALLNNSSWTKKINPHSQSKLTVFLDGIGQGHPSQADKWEYWMQELQQACMEAGKIEQPLEIDYVKGSKKMVVKASFVSREASLQDYSASLPDTKTLEWNNLRKLLKHIYLAEFMPEESVKKPDDKGDPFLHLGGGQWYNLEKANLYLLKKNDWLEKLDTLLSGQLSDPSA